MNMACQEIVLWNVDGLGATGRNVGTEANWTTGTPKKTTILVFGGGDPGHHRLSMSTDER
ncbi:MAG: hypothetical protein IPO69_00340 [Saprospiraceae bacterium]|nr:hypothetical protein [Saprospiraceae bacterium]